jgi:hypothetical protein
MAKVLDPVPASIIAQLRVKKQDVNIPIKTAVELDGEVGVEPLNLWHVLVLDQWPHHNVCWPREAAQSLEKLRRR